MYVIEESIKTKIMTITPELSESWLKKNMTNRPFNQSSCLKLMDQLITKSWYVSNDAICFDRDGNLLNGQHRLTACINTGINFECMVMRGLDRKSFNIMDTGYKRTASDILGANKIECPKVKSTLIKFAIEYKSGRFMCDSTNKTKITNQIILDFYDKNKQKVEDASSVGQFVSKNNKSFASGIIGAFAFIFNEIDKESCALFFEQFANGENLKSGDPVLILRQQLFKNTSSKTKYSKGTTYAWVILCWNDFRANKKIKSIIFKDDKFPRAL